MPTTPEKTFEKNKAEISFREILEFTPIGILIFQRDWKIRYVNQNFFKFSGVIPNFPSNLTGQSVFETRVFTEFDIRDELNLVKNGETFEKEIVSARTLGGSKISLLLKGTPIIVEGDYTGGVLILEDIKTETAKTFASLASSAEFQNFLSIISDFFVITDKDGVVKISRPNPEDNYEFIFEPENTRTAFQPQRVSPVLFKKLLEQVVKTNKVLSTQIPFIKGTREIPARLTLIPFSSGNAETDWIIFLLKDLSKESGNTGLSEEEINELSKYQHIISTVVDGLIGLNKNGRITFWNESASKVFGLTRSEVYGKFIGKIFPSIDEKSYDDLFNDVRINKNVARQFKIGEDESIAEYFEVKMGIIGDVEEEMLILLCNGITTRIHKEKEIKKSEEHFRNIVTNSHEFICTLDIKGRITYANPSFTEAFQYKENEIIKLEFTELIDTYYLAKYKFNLKNLAENGLQTKELPLVTKLGQKVHVLAGFSSVNDIDGEIQYYNVVLTDITLKKESEKDLMLIRSIFEASQDGIALINRNKIVLVNDSFVKMFAYRGASDVLGLDPLEFVEIKDRGRITGFTELAETGKETPSRYYFSGRKLNGSTFDVENSVSAYEIENERFAVWVLRDVTEQKRAQNELLISEERYRSITENINQCIWTAERISGKLKAVLYTPAIKTITGYDAEEFLHDAALWKKIIHPDDAAVTITKMNKLYKDSARNSETFVYRVIDMLGNIIWIENRITLVRETEGTLQRIFGIVSDISIAKRAEEEMRKSAQNLKELNEAKDRFISIVSHDLRTPFSSILGFTDLLLNDKELEEELRVQYIQFIQESSKSMLGLVNSLLDWTRLQTGSIKFEPERINARTIINKSIQILTGVAMQKKINLFTTLDKEIFIHADEGLISQVFNNLISNAIKFTKQGGSIKIGAAANVDKKQIEFSVCDDGVGIKKEDIHKLFKVDTKFTTSGTSGEKGSGLGLSLVNDIIHKHGGDIWVESEPGKGTTFIFSIPVASANILLVDDMKADRLLYAKLLKSFVPNYNILEAVDGRDALTIIRENLPALVITDHKMPVMNGYDMVKQLNILELKFKPPVIVLSSDINKTVEAEYKEIGVEFVFQKPVNLANFKNAIERSLKKALFS